MAVIETLKYQQVNAIRVGRFNQGINSSFIVYQLGDLMIDTGPANQWKYVHSFVEKQQVKRVILTHFHEDHSGNSQPLQKMGIDVFAPELTQQLIAQRFAMPMIQKIIWGRPKPAKVAGLPTQIAFDATTNFTTIAVPGHCKEMNAYLLADRGWLFSGDLYIASKVRYLHRHENFSLQLDSLKRVLSYDFEVMFCPHRGIVKHGKQALQNKLDYLEGLIASAKQLHQQGMSTKQITRQLLGREDAMYLFSAGALLSAI